MDRRVKKSLHKLRSDVRRIEKKIVVLERYAHKHVGHASIRGLRPRHKKSR